MLKHTGLLNGAIPIKVAHNATPSALLVMHKFITNKKNRLKIKYKEKTTKANYK